MDIPVPPTAASVSPDLSETIVPRAFIGSAVSQSFLGPRVHGPGLSFQAQDRGQRPGGSGGLGQMPSSCPGETSAVFITHQGLRAASVLGDSLQSLRIKEGSGRGLGEEQGEGQQDAPGGRSPVCLRASPELRDGQGHREKRADTGIRKGTNARCWSSECKGPAADSKVTGQGWRCRICSREPARLFCADYSGTRGGCRESSRGQQRGQ